jgi:glycosyltransferase involved in cell wall biosynthesis
LSEAIRSLALDPERARTMGAAGRKRAEIAFDRQRVLAEEIEVYRRLAAEHAKLF